MTINVNELKTDVAEIIADGETVIGDAEDVAKIVAALPDLPGVTEVKAYVALAATWGARVDGVLHDVQTFLSE